MDRHYEHPLRAILTIAERSFRAGDVATRDLWCVDGSWRCDEAAKQMRDRAFDVAPIAEVPLRRYVRRDEAEGVAAHHPVEQCARPIDAAHLVTSDLGLADVLDILRERTFLFVIEGGRVTGIITRADLQRMPVSMVVLSLILAAEAGMDELIRAWYPGDTWLGHLSKKRQKALEERFAEVARWNAEITLLELLMLEDRLRLVGRCQDHRTALGIPSYGAFNTVAERIKRVRNTLAHGRTLLDAEADPARALDLVHDIRAFAERVWEAAAPVPAPPADTA